MDAEDILGKLEDSAQRGRRLEIRLTGLEISRSDDSRMISAVVDGLGRLQDLRIADSALSYGSMVGRWATSAVTRARQASTILREAAVVKLFPATTPSRVIDAEFSSHIVRDGSESIDANFSTTESDRIAQALGVFNEMADSRRSFRSRHVKREIASGLGSVTMSLDGSNLAISISDSLPMTVRADAIARNVVDCVQDVERVANDMRNAVIRRIMSNVRLGQGVGW